MDLRAGGAPEASKMEWGSFKISLKSMLFVRPVGNYITLEGASFAEVLTSTFWCSNCYALPADRD